MKTTLTITFCALMVLTAQAQQLKETSRELSKNASKGLLDNSFINKDGNLVFTYKMKADKKSDVVNYEDYIFDSDLNFKTVEQDNKQKEMHENKTMTSLSAFVGGGSSFNVMSMSLTLQREEWERNWNYGQQRYVWGRRLSKEVVKPRNSEGKYKGYAAYPDDENGTIFIIASADTGEKDNEIQYLGLYINSSLDLKEVPFSLKGNYSLAHCGELESGNVFAVFAPNKGSSNTSAYVYLEVSKQGNIVHNTVFTAPAPAIAIMDYHQSGDNLFLVAGSVKKAEAYDSEFASYAPIYNPGYSTSANSLMDKYEKKIYKQEFENIHLLRFEKGNLVSAGTTPVNQFKSKTKTPPSQKKATPYEGKKIIIQNFFVAPNGDCLVTGQLEDKKIVNSGQDIQYFYYDIVCLHFDKNGDLKAQYAVEKVNNDSKSEMFQSIQSFFLSDDSNTVYWEILEVKGAKGYDSFVDAYNGDASFVANYFPRIAKIDLQNTTVSDFNILGENGKFLLYKYHSFLFDKESKTRFYIGHDKDYKQLWVGKAILK